MNPVFVVILVFVALFVGIYIGRMLLKASKSSEQSVWEEKLNQATLRYEQLKEQFEQQRKSLENQIQQLLSDKEKLLSDKQSLLVNLSRREAEFENLLQKNAEQKQEVEQLQEKFTKEFENLANKILEEKSSKFTEQNKENIKNILTPLQEKIQVFEKKVEESQKENIGIHASLKEQLLHLQNQNMKITQEAENLTKALKGDSRMQGNWGELVLERVLEKSGLEKDREYFVQQSRVNEEGNRLMPDVVIHLPDNKKMIIDSKVSLTDYERLVNAEDDNRPMWLKAHVNSIKRHVDQLSDKKYEDLYDMESPDFVLMFIPIEPAFAVAINEDSSLYNKAFEKNIVIVTPTTLLATLRTIDSMWNNEKQQRNALEIAKQAGALYDKFEGLVTDLTGVGKKIDAAKSDYSAAMNKLVEGKGNIVGRVERLKKMGAKAKKALPEVIIKRAQIHHDDEE